MITDIVVIVVSRALMANLHWSTLQMARMALGVALGVAKPVMVLTPPYPCIYIELYIIVLYIYIHTYTSTSVYIYTHILVYIDMCHHPWLNICIYKYIHMYIPTHVPTYLHTYESLGISTDISVYILTYFPTIYQCIDQLTCLPTSPI